MVKKDDFSHQQSNDNTNSSLSSPSSSSSSSASSSFVFLNNNTNNKNSFPNQQPINNSYSSINKFTGVQGGPFTSSSHHSLKPYSASASQTFSGNNGNMQNLTSQLVIAAAAANNPLDVTQVYLQNHDLANAYKIPAAAVHLFNQAQAVAAHNQPSNNNSNSSSSSSSSHHHHHHQSSKESNGKDKHHHDHSRSNGNGEVVIGEETVRKREMRLMKNREAARECRRKKKEYIKCLENRVAVLETQNKALIDELKSLKALYCQTDSTH